MPKFDLHFDPPLMNAAGTLGFARDAHSAVDWARLGAFVTNPISRLPRTPAKGTRFLACPGGFCCIRGIPTRACRKRSANTLRLGSDLPSR